MHSLAKLVTDSNYHTYNLNLARSLGSLAASIVLCKLLQRHTYHQENNQLIKLRDKDGLWFYLTQEKCEEQTFLSRREQDLAIKILEKKDLIKKTLYGIPRTRHFQVNETKVFELFEHNLNDFDLQKNQQLCTQMSIAVHPNDSSCAPKRQQTKRTIKELINKETTTSRNSNLLAENSSRFFSHSNSRNSSSFFNHSFSKDHQPSSINFNQKTLQAQKENGVELQESGSTSNSTTLENSKDASQKIALANAEFKAMMPALRPTALSRNSSSFSINRNLEALNALGLEISQKETLYRSFNDQTILNAIACYKSSKKEPANLGAFLFAACRDNWKTPAKQEDNLISNKSLARKVIGHWDNANIKGVHVDIFQTELTFSSGHNTHIVKYEDVDFKNKLNGWINKLEPSLAQSKARVLDELKLSKIIKNPQANQPGITTTNELKAVDETKSIGKENPKSADQIEVSKQTDLQALQAQKEEIHPNIEAMSQSELEAMLKDEIEAIYETRPIAQEKQEVIAKEKLEAAPQPQATVYKPLENLLQKQLNAICQSQSQSLMQSQSLTQNVGIQEQPQAIKNHAEPTNERPIVRKSLMQQMLDAKMSQDHVSAIAQPEEIAQPQTAQIQTYLEPQTVQPAITQNSQTPQKQMVEKAMVVEPIAEKIVQDKAEIAPQPQAANLEQKTSIYFSEDEKNCLRYLRNYIPAKGEKISETEAIWWIQVFGVAKIKTAMQVYTQQVEKALKGIGIPLPESIGNYVKNALHQNLKPSHEKDIQNVNFANGFKIRKDWTDLIATEKYSSTKNTGQYKLYHVNEALFKQSLQECYTNCFSDHGYARGI
jgi:hypothetical protein